MQINYLIYNTNLASFYNASTLPMDTLQVEYRKVNLNKTKTGKHEKQVGTTRQFVNTETKQIYYENRKYWI